MPLIIAVIALVASSVLLAGCELGRLGTLDQPPDRSKVEMLSVSYTTGGGFGTASQTCDKTVTIDKDGNVTLENDYDPSLVEHYKIDEETAAELKLFIEERADVFMGDVKLGDGCDGPTESIKLVTADGQVYETGGYMVSDQRFETISDKIVEAAGKDRFEEYLSKVYGLDSYHGY